MTTSISLRMCVLCLCHLCCSPDDKSYSNKKVCYCQHIFTQFLFYFFKMRKGPFYHVFGLFLFLLNTVFSMNCVCYHVIVTNIPTICFLPLSAFPCKIQLPVRHMIFHISDQNHFAVILRVGHFSLPLVKIRSVSQISHIAHQAFQAVSCLLHIRQAIIGIKVFPFSVFPGPSWRCPPLQMLLQHYPTGRRPSYILSVHMLQMLLQIR